jgi:hypothetical protein
MFFDRARIAIITRANLFEQITIIVIFHGLDRIRDNA